MEAAGELYASRILQVRAAVREECETNWKVTVGVFLQRMCEKAFLKNERDLACVFLCLVNQEQRR